MLSSGSPRVKLFFSVLHVPRRVKLKDGGQVDGQMAPSPWRLKSRGFLKSRGLPSAIHVFRLFGQTLCNL